MDETKSGANEQPKLTSFPKSKIKVLLMESISQSAVDCFVKEGFQVECAHKLPQAELEKKISDVHVIGVRSKTKLTKEVLSKAKRLLCIGAFCIGTDQTDLKYAANRGIPVFNAPFANTRSVAEMVISEIIALARQIGDRSKECHDKIWNKRSKGCYEVRGKTLGIIGYGHVGSQLSILAEALGMRVLFYDIAHKLPLGNATSTASLDELLPQCEFVSLHVPRDPSTQNLIDAKRIAQMSPGSYLLNLSRGSVVDVAATAEALKSGHLAGAAFDVFPTEPASKADPFVTPLQGCPNTILTPHIGGSTEEAQASIGVEVALKLISFVNQGITVTSVNFPEVDLKKRPGCHRILNTHQNKPGVLRDINNLLSGYNVSTQVLMTNENIGYLVIELDKEMSREVKREMKKVDGHIKTRVLF